MPGVLEEEARFGEGGTYLHALVHRGPKDSPAVVLCHPHPTFGGAMDFYLLVEIVKELSKEGFTTLRFNYRGVPPSTGTYGQGWGEVEDITRAVSFVRQQRNVDPQRIALVGYSFGGSLALVAARKANPKAIVAISAAVNPHETRLDVTEYAKMITAPTLLIHGKADEMVPYSDSERILKALTNSKERVLQLVDGANHIYTGKGKTVVSLTASFLTKNL